MKNPHAVALGRLGGAKGGPARAKALSPQRRSQIATRAARARARSLTAAERQELARRAAAARWSKPPPITTMADAPAAIRRLFKKYEAAALHWADGDHRYVIVREILLRGDDRAVGWLRGFFSARKMRELVASYGAVGCDERQRRKLRSALRLTLDDIPDREDPGRPGAPRG